MTDQRKSLYERLVLKEKIGVLKRARALNVIEEELQRNESICDQLSEIAEEGAVQKGLTTPLALRSASHYGLQVHEQLTTASNRSDFLKDERDARHKLLVDAMTRHRKVEDKNDAERRRIREEKADKAFDSMPQKRTS